MLLWLAVASVSLLWASPYGFSVWANLSFLTVWWRFPWTRGPRENKKQVKVIIPLSPCPGSHARPFLEAITKFHLGSRGEKISSAFWWEERGKDPKYSDGHFEKMRLCPMQRSFQLMLFWWLTNVSYLLPYPTAIKFTSSSLFIPCPLCSGNKEQEMGACREVREAKGLALLRAATYSWHFRLDLEWPQPRLITPTAAEPARFPKQRTQRALHLSVLFTFRILSNWQEKGLHVIMQRM